jgi:4-hydroxy-2-oxoglutarate aldolase
MGAVGGILALANVLPGKCIEIQKAFEEGDLDRAALLQESIVELNLAITRKHGVPALKAVMDEVGFFGGTARHPLLPLEDKIRNELLEILRNSG